MTSQAPNDYVCSDTPPMDDFGFDEVSPVRNGRARGKSTSTKPSKPALAAPDRKFTKPATSKLLKRKAPPIDAKGKTTKRAKLLQATASATEEVDKEASNGVIAMMRAAVEKGEMAMCY